MSTPHTITRTRVLMRAKYGWERKTVPFSRTEIHRPDGYRQDAAGFVSMCYDIPLDAPHSWGGLSTVTLVSWFTEISPHELKPGDLLGYLGPDSMEYDGGTAVIFEKWLNDDPALGTALTWGHLPTMNPGPDLRAQAISYRWHAYRFNGIVEEAELPV